MAEDEKPVNQTVEAEPKKKLTLEDFITKHPLYSPFPIEPVQHLNLPDSLSYHCDGPPPCGKETTWLRVKAEPDYVSASGAEGFHVVCYVCARCKDQELWVMYREFTSDLGSVVTPMPPAPITPLRKGGSAASPTRHVILVTTSLQKVGQVPPLSIDLPKELAKNLGDEAVKFYKRALINRNEGYGLAAVTYIRRVVEDKTNELLEVVAEQAEAHDVDAKVVEKIRAAKTQRITYEQKLELASTVLPTLLTPAGANPLSQLHDLVSQGLHGLSEEQCVAIADETRSVFEYTFSHLRGDTKKTKEFVAKVTKWAGGKGSG